MVTIWNYSSGYWNKFLGSSLIRVNFPRTETYARMSNKNKAEALGNQDVCTKRRDASTTSCNQTTKAVCESSAASLWFVAFMLMTIGDLKKMIIPFFMMKTPSPYNVVVNQTTKDIIRGENPLCCPICCRSSEALQWQNGKGLKFLFLCHQKWGNLGTYGHWRIKLKPQPV